MSKSKLNPGDVEDVSGGQATIGDGSLRNKVHTFVLTIKKITGLPTNWETVELQHPTTKEKIQLTAVKGTVSCNATVEVKRKYENEMDKKADIKFRLLHKGKKQAKVHLNLEKLRLGVEIMKKELNHVVHLEDNMALNIDMTFSVDYYSEDASGEKGDLAGQSSFSSVDSEAKEKLVVLKLPPGPLGASFANTLIPPTILRLVTLPDGSESPFLGKVVARSELIRFNDMDTTTWGLSQLKDYLQLTKQDPVRELVFRLPNSEQPDVEQLSERQIDMAARKQDSLGSLSGIESSNSQEELQAPPQLDDQEARQQQERLELQRQQQQHLHEQQRQQEQLRRLQEQQREQQKQEQEAQNRSFEHLEAQIGFGMPRPDSEGKDHLRNGADTHFAPAHEEHLNPAPSFRIRIERYVRAKDDNFILYVITSSGISRNKSEVSVLRRYNNFVSLKDQLEKESRASLPSLPPKYSFTAVFNRFSEDFVQERRSLLEEWINTLYKSREMRGLTLIDFLTQEPEYDFVLDFSSKERLEVVVKTQGTIRLYKNGDIRTPKTPWIPTENELKKQLDSFSLFNDDQPAKEHYHVPLSPAVNAAPLKQEEQEKLKNSIPV